MSVTHPAAFWLLLLVPVLFWRRLDPQTRLAVSALHLWRSAAPAQAGGRLRLRRLDRRLLVEAAIACAIITAVAGPHWAAAIPDVAVVIDVSASMRARETGGTRLDAARAGARGAISALMPWSRVHLFVAGPGPAETGALAANDPRLARRLDELAPTDGGADLETAVAAATAAAPQVYVFSDTRAPAGLDADRVRWTVVGRPLDNAAVTTFAASSDDGAPPHVLVAVANFGASPAERTLTVAARDKVLYRERVRLAPGARATALVASRGATGIITAQLDPGDALADDDRRALVAGATEPVRVHLIDAGLFLEQAIRAMRDAVVIAGSAAAATDADVIVCGRCATLPPGRAGLLVAGRAEAAHLDPQPLVASAAPHPLLDGVSLDGVAAVPAPLPGRLPPVDVLARAAQQPALVAGADGGRRVVVLGLDVEASPLALDPAFPLLVANAVRWLGASRRSQLTLDAGDPFAWPIEIDAAMSGVSARGPDGRSIPVTWSRDRLTVGRTGSAGTYSMRVGTAARTFVVNTAPGESDLRGARAPGASRSPAARASTSPTGDLTAIALLIAISLLAAGRKWGLA